MDQDRGRKTDTKSQKKKKEASTSKTVQWTIQIQNSDSQT